MATKETVWDMVQSMATLWRFPSQDLKATAETYHQALKDLSDDNVRNAAQELCASWGKSSAPMPADIIRIAKEQRPVPFRPPRLPRKEPTHEEIITKVKRDTYASQAIIEVLGSHKPFEKWTEAEKTAVAKRQAELRAELGMIQRAMS